MISEFSSDFDFYFEDHQLDDFEDMTFIIYADHNSQAPSLDLKLALERSLSYETEIGTSTFNWIDG